MLRAALQVLAFTPIAACGDPTDAAQPNMPGAPIKQAWGELNIVAFESQNGTSIARIEAATAEVLATYEGERLETKMIDLDGAEPPEIWIIETAGAHGNRRDSFVRQVAGRPERWLKVETDEGELSVEDLDGDGHPEISGIVTVWMENAEDDLARPLVLKLADDSWLDVTNRFPARIERELASWKLAARGSSSCSPVHALNILYLSEMLNPRSSGRWLGENCPDLKPWVDREGPALGALVRDHTFFE